MITVVKNGQEKKWDNRQNAIAYYLTQINKSQGKEKSANTNIYFALICGLNFVNA